MTPTDLQRDKAVAELLEILKTSRSDKELETLMALVSHVNAVEKRLDKVLGELDSVKQKLDASKVPDTVKEAHAGVIANMQKHINHLKDMLGGLRDKIVQAATQAVDNFKQTGKTGLHAVLQGLNVRGSLEQMEKSYGKSAQMADKAVKRLDATSQELRNVGTGLRNIGRALTGRETLSSRQENGRFANAVTLPLRTNLKIYRTLGNMAHGTIAKLDKLSQDVQRGKEQKPSVKQALQDAKAAQPAPKPNTQQKAKAQEASL